MATQHACAALITENDLACCTGVPDAIVDEAIDSASDMVYLLAPWLGIGRCTSVVRPCSTTCYVCGEYMCDHCAPPGVLLPGVRPVVTKVLVDGAEVPTGSYAVIDARLVRFFPDGRWDHWPPYQNLVLPSSELNTFEVTYVHGIEADMVVRNAVAEVACDLLAPWRGDRARLPRGTTNASMNGVSVNINPDEINTAMFPWLSRFMSTYRVTSNGSAAVWSPEISGDWLLHVRS
jgi:hypothetical protein